MNKYNELIDIDDDKLGIRNTVDYIIKTFFNESSTEPLMIDGKWGIGKTSFGNFIAKAINERGKETCIVFSIWEIKNSRNIKKLILSKTWRNASCIIEFISIIAVTFMFVIGAAINNVNVNKVSIISLMMFSTFVALSLALTNKDYKNGIIDFVFSQFVSTRIKKKYILFIDDLDRLSKSEIQLVYPVLNIMSHGNRIRIVALCDKSKLPGSDDSFIDKLFPTRIPLITLLRSDLVWEYFMNELTSALSGGEVDVRYNQTDKEDIALIRELFIQKKLTSRDVTIFITAVHRYLFPNRVHTVNLGQFLIMIYLHEFSFDIYELIIDNRSILLNERFDIQGDRLSSIYKKLKSNYSTAELELIEALFGSSEDKLLTRSYIHYPISSSMYFHRYLVIESGEVETGTEIESLVLNGIFPSLYEEYDKETLLSIIDYIKNVDILIDNPKVFRRAIVNTSLKYLQKQLVREESSSIFEIDELNVLLLSLLEKQKPKDIKPVEVFSEIVQKLGKDVILGTILIPKYTKNQFGENYLLFLEILKNVKKETNIKNVGFIYFFQLLGSLDVTKYYKSKGYLLFNKVLALDDHDLCDFVENYMTRTFYDLLNNRSQRYLDVDKLGLNEYLKLKLQSRLDAISDEYKERINNLIDRKLN